MIEEMKLFNGGNTTKYFEDRLSKLKEEISNITDVDIMTCDFDEWVDFLYKKYEIIPLTLFEESKIQFMQKEKLKKYNEFYRHSTYEVEYFLIDGVRITYSIPYDGDSNLWHLQPNSYILTTFNVESIKDHYKDKCGTIELAFEYTNEELQNKGDQMKKFVEDRFENKFKSYRTMIGYVNEEVNSYNNSLKSFVLKCLDVRKQKASSFSLISQMLEIPLPKSSSAPNVKPILLERIKRTPVNKPKQKVLPNEYCISDKDYENINNIIYMCGTTMEKTARTYYRNNEEELRDHLLAALNTHYQNAAGETFRKIGKTDINIEFENKAAFIGECKIWHGEKKFAEAVQQVLNYSTWKDVKVSVIIFNKENQSFQGVIKKINEWIKINVKSHIQQKNNEWECKYYREDMNIEIKLNISAFDLYVDKSQFQDSRN